MLMTDEVLVDEQMTAALLDRLDIYTFSRVWKLK